MQRKNNILKSARSGMAMIMAITVIVIMATIMALSLALTATTTKRTTDIYLYEQAVLVSKSAAELALLSIAENTPCNVPATDLNYRLDLDGDGSISDDIYDVNITLRYFYKDLSCPGNYYFTTITTDEQNGSVLMDIAVTTNVGTEPIRYFRRTIQKL